MAVTLAEYAKLRQVTLDALRDGFSKITEPDKLERFIHSVFYPAQSSYDYHNLWLIDDRLAFSYFLASDKPFGNSSERVDLLVLDSPVAVVDSKNSGVAYSSVTLFELKRPGRDDYSDDDNPVRQLYRYLRKLQEGTLKDQNQRPIKTDEATQFHLYAVCDITPSLKRILDDYGFSPTGDGLGAFYYNPRYKAYIEVLSYDKIRNDAEKRNRALFDKLGMR